MIHPTTSKLGRILFYPAIVICQYLGYNHPKLLLTIRYYRIFGKKPNLNQPKGLNEKIIWAKLYSNTEQWTLLADKYRVRQYISDLGYADNLVALYDVWFDVKDINLDNLPERFIIKANNGDGKGTNKIYDKKELSDSGLKSMKNTVSFWLDRKHVGILSAEPQYLNMKPCVVVEEVLPPDEYSSSLTDYKIWCFKGKAHCIYVCNNRRKDGSGAQVMMYDLNWNPRPEMLRYSSDYSKGEIIPKPRNLNMMIEMAEMLSEPFPQVRVDLYNVNGKVYFGELTFTAGGGLNDDHSEICDLELGQLVDIKDFELKR